MGLFDKKKKGRDDFGSPVEQIDLSAASAGDMSEDDEADDAPPAERTVAPSTLRAPASAPSPARAAEPERRPARAPDPPPSRYGIDDAVALMRTLPSENIELVVQVVKHTLESARIDIATIIQDAVAKQERTESRIAVLKNAIEELEREIDTRQAEIGQLESDNRETMRVKERLVLAERLSQGGRPDTVVDTPTSPQRAWETAPPPSPAPRQKSPTTPPPTPGQSSATPGQSSATPAGGSPTHATNGNPGHTASGNLAVPSPVGPGGPVGGSSGAYAKVAPSHTVIAKK